ncbi:hypothetical protein [Filimonas effusa]|uniref:Cthe-2314-like HEPN domain-containing protein n=1 Tax=Filimonas effusa TaxID=2508721 RepID=A0A4Q1DBQ4_9BACT|nr:hypothetical protein [Filimonas effusa]RXK86872.1 hypothetical protein ESB13_08795 [Filimonas effusa]
MKHIEKKFILRVPLGGDANELLKNAPIPDKTELEERLRSGYYPLLIGEDNMLTQAFVYNLNKKDYRIPEPNPVTLYFHIAQSHLRVVREKRLDLLRDIDNNQFRATTDQHLIYDFFGNTAVFTTFLFNSIECFINYKIPETYKFTREGTQKSETFNAQQIQRNLPFDDKIKLVIPEIFGKSFHLEEQADYTKIDKLKRLRDEIMHTKQTLNTANKYESFYIDLLNFNFDKTILAVRNYINYYEPGTITECKCGNDF